MQFAVFFTAAVQIADALTSNIVQILIDEPPPLVLSRVLTKAAPLHRTAHCQQQERNDEESLI